MSTRHDSKTSVDKHTYIFCATSTPLRFFSYCASFLLSELGLTGTNWPDERSTICSLRGHLLDGKFFISLDPDLPSLFQGLLLDESHAWTPSALSKRTILFISLKTSSLCYLNMRQSHRHPICPSSNVNLLLRLNNDRSELALSIPLVQCTTFATTPLKWLRFVGFVIYGRQACYLSTSINGPLGA